MPPRPRFPFAGSRLARISDPGLINTIRNCASETNFQDSMLGPGKSFYIIDLLFCIVASAKILRLYFLTKQYSHRNDGEDVWRDMATRSRKFLNYKRRLPRKSNNLLVSGHASLSLLSGISVFSATASVTDVIFSVRINKKS